MLLKYKKLKYLNNNLLPTVPSGCSCNNKVKSVNAALHHGILNFSNGICSIGSVLSTKKERTKEDYADFTQNKYMCKRLCKTRYRKFTSKVV